MQKKVSDIIAEYLKVKEIKHVFGVIGSANAHIFDSITNLGYTKIICNHNEQASVMAMVGYYKATGKMSAAILTAGAGASNGITGVIHGWMDSTPGIIFVANEKSQFTSLSNPLRIWGVQGYDSVQMVEKVTKFADRLLETNQTLEYLEKAYNSAITGRPGPSWLEIPFDIQAKLVDTQEIINVKDTDSSVSIQYNFDKDLKAFNDLLKSSKRPIFWLGYGIRLAKAEHLVSELVDKFKIPVLLTWSGIDLLGYDNPYNFGSGGVYGQRAATFILQNCDLIISIGTRMSIMQIGHDINEFAREAKIIMNDIDANEVNKLGAKINLPVICDAKVFIESLLQKVENKTLYDITDWLAYCNKMKVKYPRVGVEHQDKNNYINSYHFMGELFKILPKDATMVTDTGTALLSSHQISMIKYGQRLTTTYGLGEMGYGLPAAIGASTSIGYKKVICLNTDGGIMMNLQELQTIAHYQLPIKIFIFNNDGYLMIKHTQKAMFNGRYTGTNKATGVSCPDYKKIATAFNFPYYSIKTWDDFNNINVALDSNEACIIEVFMDLEQPLVPKLGLVVKADGSLVSPPLEDLSPLLPREEFKEDMLIPIHPMSLLK